ncbi:fidgetin-like protein 1 [Pyrus ussuriensis x Pyrus communis]|uniref:Fidgetin-like protein 1 n=1 Tax=Pyrus ussuriensis x Pyrus communis TaxID=2448454 RepID=A0A5N5GA93_9ROSA|nr:fidgetin-like protein 1 [Pyrus ussuriensis x Pyrus communis]
MSQRMKAMVERRARLGVEEAEDLSRGEAMPFDSELDDKAGGDTNLQRSLVERSWEEQKGDDRDEGRCICLWVLFFFWDFCACCVCMALGFI